MGSEGSNFGQNRDAGPGEVSLAHLESLRHMLRQIEGDIKGLMSSKTLPMNEESSHSAEEWETLSHLLPSKADVEILLEYLIQEVGNSNRLNPACVHNFAV